MVCDLNNYTKDLCKYSYILTTRIFTWTQPTTINKVMGARTSNTYMYNDHVIPVTSRVYSYVYCYRKPTGAKTMAIRPSPPSTGTWQAVLPHGWTAGGRSLRWEVGRSSLLWSDVVPIALGTHQNCKSTVHFSLYKNRENTTGFTKLNHITRYAI